MNLKTEELLERTFRFGVDVLKFLRALPKDIINNIIIFQLGKASTSCGSNYEEAQGAESIRDFNHKIGIALKEIRESNYWLRILSSVLQDSYNDKELKHLLNESLELKKIFSVIKKKAQQNSIKEKNRSD